MPFLDSNLGVNLVAASGQPGLSGLSASDLSDLSSAASQQYVKNAIASSTGENFITVAAVSALSANTYYNGPSDDGEGATITFNATGVQTVDGRQLELNDIVGVFAEASALKNGIYLVTTAPEVGVAGVLTRATNFDTSADMVSGFDVVAQLGTNYKRRQFRFQTDSAIVVGTNSISFKAVDFYSSANAALSFSDAGVATINTAAASAIVIGVSGLDLQSGNGLVVSSNTLALNLAASSPFAFNSGALDLTIGNGLIITSNTLLAKIGSGLVFSSGSIIPDFADAATTIAKSSTTKVVNPAGLASFTRYYDAGAITAANLAAGVTIDAATHGLATLCSGAYVFKSIVIKDSDGVEQTQNVNYSVEIDQANGDITISAGTGFDCHVAFMGA